MSEIGATERLRRQCIEVCPFRVGHRVRVKDSYLHAGDWRGEYVIVSLTWEYQKGDGHDINVGIASDDEIINRHGWTDGFKVKDIEPVPQRSL